MKFKLTIVFIFFVLFLSAQEKISFIAEDDLKVTADLYMVNPEKPFILLFHQAGSSRGEYNQIANKISKFGYNCLAVDLRSGGEVNYIQNQTSLLAIKQGYPVDYMSCKKDIEAAINWATKRNNNPVVLFGSSFSASLCLLAAKENPNIRAVIAFSPGEFFTPEYKIQPEIQSLNIPVFAASSQREKEYVQELFNELPSANKTLFAPKSGGEHGSKSLWKSNPNSQEYWLALTMFFSKIR